MKILRSAQARIKSRLYRKLNYEHLGLCDYEDSENVDVGDLINFIVFSKVGSIPLLLWGLLRSCRAVVCILALLIDMWVLFVTIS